MARRFDGSSGYIASHGLNTTVSTWALWFYPRVRPGIGAYGTMVGFQDSGGANEKSLALLSTGVVEYYCYDGGVKLINTGSGGIAYENNSRWNHIVATQDGSNMHIYCDGRLTISGACGASYAAYTLTSTLLRVGGGVRRGGSPPEGYFNGDLAHVAFWKSSLNGAQARLLANGMSPLQVKPGDLVGYWPLETNAPSIVPDEYKSWNGISTSGFQDLRQVAATQWTIPFVPEPVDGVSKTLEAVSAAVPSEFVPRAIML